MYAECVHTHIYIHDCLFNTTNHSFYRPKTTADGQKPGRRINHAGVCCTVLGNLDFLDYKFVSKKNPHTYWKVEIVQIFKIYVLKILKIR